MRHPRTLVSSLPAHIGEVGCFGWSAYLAQSPQLCKQLAITGGTDRALEGGSALRTEPSHTSRHATEFTGVDAELAWIDDVEDVMACEEEMLAHAIGLVAERHGAAIRAEFGTEAVVPGTPFPRITTARDQEVPRAGGSDPAGVEQDLDAEGERGIAAWATAEHGHECAFVTPYPAGIRPPYRTHPAGREDLTLSFDLLWKGLEITSGAQREHRHDVLLTQAADKGTAAEPLRDYLNAFRFGCPPHGGFGTGLGRVVMVLLGLDSLRGAAFPFRGPNGLTP